MRNYVAGLFVIFVSCGEPIGMLHETDSYAGTIELSGAGGGTITGRLTFDRVSGNLQFQIREPEVVTLVKDSSGELRAFAGERWRAISDAEVAIIELIDAAVRYRPEDHQAPVPWEDGYKITLADLQLGIRVLDEADLHAVR